MAWRCLDLQVTTSMIDEITHQPQPEVSRLLLLVIRFTGEANAVVLDGQVRLGRVCLHGDLNSTCSLCVRAFRIASCATR